LAELERTDIGVAAEHPRVTDRVLMNVSEDGLLPVLIAVRPASLPCIQEEETQKIATPDPKYPQPL
jgi:hypothetical protein